MRRYMVEVNGKEYVIDVQEQAADRFLVRLHGREYQVRMGEDADVAEARIRPEILPLRAGEGGAEREGVASADIGAAYRSPEPESLPPLPASRPPSLPPQPHLGGEFRPELVAPMPGTILTVYASVGERVARGQTVLVLEAMKMKNAIKAPQDAVVEAVLVQPGQAVGYGHALLKFEPPA